MSIILTDPTPTGPIPAQRAVEHPSWCDPRRCTTTPDTDGEALVVHRVVVLDEPRGEAPRDVRLVVDVVRGDCVCAHGGELLAQDPAGVRVRGVDELTELTPEQAARLAAAVARAVEIAGSAR